MDRHGQLYPVDENGEPLGEDGNVIDHSYTIHDENGGSYRPILKFTHHCASENDPRDLQQKIPG